MSKVLAIHEVTPEILAIPKEVLAEYILTFDDGLYSQYLNWEHFRSIPTTKVFFISPNVMAREGEEQIKAVIPCEAAHIQAFEHDICSAYINKEQLKQLQSEGAVIGGHSFSHFKEASLKERFLERGYLDSLFTFMKEDTEKMLDWFKSEMSLDIKYFCFPYNNEYRGLYRALISKVYKIPNIFGDERTPIEDLL